jgi:hypothetical protein
MQNGKYELDKSASKKLNKFIRITSTEANTFINRKGA